MDVIEEKDEFALEAEARMKAPLEWDSTAKCKILDLKESQYDEALHLIKRHFFREDPMCKSSSLLQDQTSVNDYLQLIRTWMKDTTSLVATSILSGRVVGVAVMRINSGPEKTDTYNRVQILEGDTLKKIMHLQNALLIQANAHEVFGCEEYFCIYILCVHPSYQEKGVEYALLNASVQVATTLKMRAIGGIFTCGVSQTRARSVGFQLLSEIRYSLWTINDHTVFDDPGRGNYSAAFMGQLIPLEEDAQDE
ncbi:PREDICTED: uncharacterized protein LOC108553280 [Eufriesea mexicana]|uniref:uncharacterized protein LOC108553280 n=1 Tax=Eufriesea mexicana TaxID=516756 RepID=UPI00083C3360|nr:PREDICTED: uncharacterized protein LOC108553280 [Eufriesea mexicana]